MRIFTRDFRGNLHAPTRPMPIRRKVLILFLVFMNLAVIGHTQKITLSKTNASLRSVLDEIRKQSGYDIIFDANLINNAKPVTVHLTASSVEKALDACLKNEPLTYTIEDRFVTLRPKPQTVAAPPAVNNATVKEVEITGRVADEKNQPMSGATVALQNSPVAVSTKADGTFSITVPNPNAVLVFSFVGYQSQALMVGARTVINITLVEQPGGINEVVVVAYGTQKKETLTGAVTNIKGSDLLTTKTPNLIQSIQGKMAGVQIRQSSSIPGGGQTSINIRGFGTPLVVIDGVVRDGVSELERLDPNDIESISVLKDGSAAIYGIGASNGVLLVTTKRGTKGPVKVSFSGNTGFSSPTSLPKAIASADWIDLKNELSVNTWNGMSYSADEIQKYKEGVLPGYESVNWYDETMKPYSLQLQQNLSLRGGSEGVTYFISGGYTRDNGLVKSNPLNYSQLNFRANSNVRLSRSLNLELNLSGQRGVNNQITSGGFLNILKGIMAAAPFQRPYVNDDPNYPTQIASGTNPVALINSNLVGYNTTQSNLIRSSAALNYDIPWVKGLQVRIFGAYDFNVSNNKNLQRLVKLYKSDPATQQPVLANTFANDAITGNNLNSQRTNVQAQVSYKTVVAGIHNVSGTLVFEQRKTNFSSLLAKRNYDFFTTDVLNQGSLVNQVTDGTEVETANLSYVGRLNYNYRQKYLAEFIFREDGSYRYNPNRRWGFFPGASIGWRVSEEGFVKKKLKIISNLKFRASYGETGQDAGDPFQYIEGYQTGSTTGYEFIDGQWTSAVLSPSLVNLNLTWFHAKTYDVGFDLELFKKGKLGITFDLYRRDRSGLLGTRYLTLPNTFGASLPQENLNADRVEGLDFSISHSSRIGAFKYSINANLNFSRSLTRYVEQGPFQSSYSKWRNDLSYRNKNIVWGYEVIGRFESWDQIRNYPVFMDGGSGNITQLPGDPIYKDTNGDGVISADDMLPIYRGGQLTNGNSVADYESGQPPLQYGLNLSGSWKGLDFNCLVQGAALYTIALGTEWQTPMYSDRSAPQYLADRWHLADPADKNSEWIPGYFPASRNPLDAPQLRLSNNIYRRNASYVRLKNVELGYTLPKSILQRWRIDRARFYVNATNLFTKTDKILKLFDPERGEGDYGGNYAYPLIKSLNVGVNLTF